MTHQAELAFLEADNDNRLRRAMNAKPRPSRGPFLPGTQVYFWRRRGKLKGDPGEFWQGPAVVVAGLDNDLWLSFHNYIIKAAPE